MLNVCACCVPSPVDSCTVCVCCCRSYSIYASALWPSIALVIAKESTATAYGVVTAVQVSVCEFVNSTVLLFSVRVFVGALVRVCVFCVLLHLLLVLLLLLLRSEGGVSCYSKLFGFFRILRDFYTSRSANPSGFPFSVLPCV